ncbi:MAG: 16S rRNA (uracil(1498)-N(3))-methyltransferase [Prevotellaceae bacterium]|jgi:16S rRNA (uracil1498-N3)-methyltransferase|nr:16S rRNA (uracil(1498)-N(3))-methyltransferase [Prevotellaceae bacterium]
MHLFYTPDIIGETYTLCEEESKHCVRVLRLNVGDTVHLIDGHGGLYTAQISSAHDKRCTVHVAHAQQEFGKRSYHLHIAIAPTKNVERYEWFLEKATEIGIDEITPLLCERSERKAVKHDRSEKVITAAVKQSLKAYHPRLNPMQGFADFVAQGFEGVKGIAHCMDSPKTPLPLAVSPHSRLLMLVGPEGDFSPSEVDIARRHGFAALSLGAGRLRTETAGVVACSMVAALNL